MLVLFPSGRRSVQDKTRRLHCCDGSAVLVANYKQTSRVVQWQWQWQWPCPCPPGSSRSACCACAGRCSSRPTLLPEVSSSFGPPSARRKKKTRKKKSVVLVVVVVARQVQSVPRPSRIMPLLFYHLLLGRGLQPIYFLLQVSVCVLFLPLFFLNSLSLFV